MSDYPENMGDLNQVQAYRQLVLDYEALDEEIDALLAKHDGATENMTSTDFERYRELARRRDIIYNQLKALEQQLLDDDDEQPGT